MAATRELLHKRLRTRASSLDLPSGRIWGDGEAPSVEERTRKGDDPVHAAYSFIQNVTSAFAEAVSVLPEMKAYFKVVAAAEREYMPGGPPFSPLTASYFTCWAFYDLRFDGTDTLASCLIEANDLVRLTPDQLDALKNMASSRMGVYEHAGMDGPHVRLRELLTDDEFTCHSTSGYRGRTGELWYVRLLPPLSPDRTGYHVTFTTPYVLMARRDLWQQFLRRTMAPHPSGDDRRALHQLLKYGPEANYWNEYVLLAYVNYRHDVIFLAGIPDLKASLPHA